MGLIDRRKDVFVPGPGLGPVLVPVLVLLAAAVTVNCESHSLTYIYTAFSKEPSSPGLRRFTALGLLDGRVIDYFDSDHQEKVPRQDWMKEQEDKKYWEKGSATRKSKMDWFNINIGILMERMRQNQSDLHTLQWLHGCEAKKVQGQVAFTRGLDMYNYDGRTFLEFDDINGVWFTTNTAAEPTKRKWDGVVALKDYTKGYLEKECCDWMDKFLQMEKAGLQKSPPPPPQVDLFTTPSPAKGRLRLTCLASGFYHRGVDLRMTRSGQVLVPANGLQSSGVRPNHDDTFQQRDTVEILSDDPSEFTCELHHPSYGAPYRAVWDKSQLPVSMTTILGGAVGGLLAIAIVVLVLVVLHKKGKIACECGKKEEETSSVSKSSDEFLISAGKQSSSCSSSTSSGEQSVPSEEKALMKESDGQKIPV